MNLFKSTPRSNLILEAHREAVQMLELGEEMFRSVTGAFAGDALPEEIEKIKQQDKVINRIHRNVRRKVFEHLSITGNESLFSSLVLLSVVDDSERIGDYDKNIAELIHLMPKHLEFGEYTETFERLWQQTNDLFDDTLVAFRDDDEKSAARVLAAYPAISDACDHMIEQIIGDPTTTTIDKNLVALILLVRYFKRVDAHLKNIASTVINPFHRIGYKAKKSEIDRLKDQSNE